MSTINTYERADQLFRVINSPFGQLPAPKLYNWEEFYELQLKHLSNYWHYSSRLLARSLNRTFIDNWRFSNNCFHRGQDPVSEARAFDQEKCDAASTKKQGMFQVSFLIHISFRDCCSFILKVTKTGRYHSTGYFLSRQNHANDSIPITTAVAAVPEDSENNRSRNRSCKFNVSRKATTAKNLYNFATTQPLHYEQQCKFTRRSLTFFVILLLSRINFLRTTHQAFSKLQLSRFRSLR